MTRLATILALIAAPAFADDRRDLSGTLVILAPTDEPGAVAEVQIRNQPFNGTRDNGTFPLTMGGITVSVTYTWDAEGSADRIEVETDGSHFAWPETLDVHEGRVGTIAIFPLHAAGM